MRVCSKEHCTEHVFIYVHFVGLMTCRNTKSGRQNKPENAAYASNIFNKNSYKYLYSANIVFKVKS